MSVPPAEPAQRCGNCRWAHTDTGGEPFYCHRYPPQYQQQKPTTSWWPEVMDADWCGEWMGGGSPTSPGA